MMKKTSLLTLVSLLVLSACGGSDGPVIDNSTKPKPEVTDQTGKGFTVHQIVEYDSISNPDLISKGMNISQDNYKYIESPNEGKNYNKIEINGRLMEIFPKKQREYYLVVDEKNNITAQGVGDNTVTIADSKKDDVHRLWVGKTAYSTYGIVADNYTQEYTGTDPQGAEACKKAGNCSSVRARLFYQGQPTLDIPATGTATYKGGAILHILTSNHVGYGKSSFDVDFGKKEISGKITDVKPFNGSDTFKDIALKTAKIQGNAFKTEQMEGKFYGPKAAAVSGYFIDKEQNLHGAFGAEQVKK